MVWVGQLLNAVGRQLCKAGDIKAAVKDGPAVRSEVALNCAGLAGEVHERVLRVQALDMDAELDPPFIANLLVQITGCDNEDWCPGAKDIALRADGGLFQPYLEEWPNEKGPTFPQACIPAKYQAILECSTSKVLFLE